MRYVVSARPDLVDLASRTLHLSMSCPLTLHQLILYLVRAKERLFLSTTRIPTSLGEIPGHSDFGQSRLSEAAHNPHSAPTVLVQVGLVVKGAESGENVSCSVGS